jgi:hypothetical protein
MQKLKQKISSRRKGQTSMNQLQGYAIAFVVIGVALTVGLQVLTGISAEMHQDRDVTGELHAPTSLPAEVTVDNVGDGLVTDSETIKWYDASASTNTTLDKSSDYTVVSYENGTFEVLNNFDYNQSDGDELYFDYTWEDPDTKASQGADSAISGLTTFTDWLPIIAIVVVSSLIIGLVMRFGSRKGGSYGRA